MKRFCPNTYCKTFILEKVLAPLQGCTRKFPDVRHANFCSAIHMRPPITALWIKQCFWATRCGLDGPGIESRWIRDFPHLPRSFLGLTQPSIYWISGLFLGVKRPKRGLDQRLLLSAEVKARADLNPCPPSGASWSVLG